MLLGRACSLGVMPRDRVIDRLAHRFELEWSTGAVSVSDRLPNTLIRPVGHLLPQAGEGESW